MEVAVLVDGEGAVAFTGFAFELERTPVEEGITRGRGMLGRDVR